MQVVSVAAGGHSLAVDSVGHVWVWGRNSSDGGGGYGASAATRALLGVEPLKAGSPHAQVVRRFPTLGSWGTT